MTGHSITVYLWGTKQPQTTRKAHKNATKKKKENHKNANEIK